jgi:hypothetical protein
LVHFAQPTSRLNKQNDDMTAEVMAAALKLA